MNEPRLYAVGDVHDDLARLMTICQGARRIDEKGRWSGGGSALILVGDLTDQGDQVLAVMRLQEEGDVEALMGNHDALILAREFEWRGERADPDCRELFIANGGKDREAKALARDMRRSCGCRPAPSCSR